MPVRATDLSPDSALHRFVRGADFLDCYSVELSQGDFRIDEVTGFIFTEMPAWINTLLGIRDAVVSMAGLKTTAALAQPGRPRKINFLRVHSATDEEIILGEDDRHLDFRIAVRRDGEQPSRISLATWVRTHNLLGRVYLRAILPLHVVIVRSRLSDLGRRYA